MNIEFNDPKFKVGQRVSFYYPEYNQKKYIGFIENVNGYSELKLKKNNFYANWIYKIKVDDYNSLFGWQHYSGIREEVIEECNEPDYRNYFEFLIKRGIKLDSGRYQLVSFNWSHDKNSAAYYKNLQMYNFQFYDRIYKCDINFSGLAELKDVNKLLAVG
jgi:hypothetical protein